MANKVEMRALLETLHEREGKMVETLRAFVECESPSHDKAAVDRFGEIVAEEWRKRGADVRVIENAERGNHIRAEIDLTGGAGARKAKQILILGHLDTVYPVGTIVKMPFRVAGGKAFGPGTFDMKAGIVQALFAVDAMRMASVSGARKLVFFWDSDEEIGSHTSRKLIEAEARKSEAVLVLEPSLGPKGLLKTERKGVGTATITVRGKAAHTGINPQAGVNAVHELALQIERLMKMNESKRGVTVQATVIAGGTASNVVSAEARAEVDVRCSRLSDVARVNKRITGLKPILKGARLEISGGINRPPLERTAGVAKLFGIARQIGKAMGLELGEAATGGGSDGNFTAALGVPTLDGLGAVGDGAHAPHEHVVIQKMSERAALLAGLMAVFGKDDSNA